MGTAGGESALKLPAATLRMLAEGYRREADELEKVAMIIDRVAQLAAEEPRLLPLNESALTHQAPGRIPQD